MVLTCSTSIIMASLLIIYEAIKILKTLDIISKRQYGTGFAHGGLMTIVLSEHYPKIIKDLFRYDNKTQNLTPCESYDVILASMMHFPVEYPFDYDNNAILKEAMALPYKKKNNGVSKSTVITISNNLDDDEEDMVHQHENMSPIMHNLYDAPHITKLIQDLNNHIGKITYLSFKTMEPGGYIYPHVDSLCSPTIYHPLHWPNGNYFKWFEHGLVDFSNYKPNFINNNLGLHCVVNESNDTRVSFSFNLDFQDKKAQEFIVNSYKKLTST